MLFSSFEAAAKYRRIFTRNVVLCHFKNICIHRKYCMLSSAREYFRRDQCKGCANNLYPSSFPTPAFNPQHLRDSIVVLLIQVWLNLKK